MKKMKFIVFLFLIMIGNASYSAYKCIERDGSVSFQAMPCENDSHSETINIRNSKSCSPFTINTENKRKYKMYAAYANQKVNVDACVTRDSKYSTDISEAYTRFYEIGKSELEEGKIIFDCGFRGLPSSEIRQIKRDALRKRKSEISKMNMSSIDLMCKRHASGLRQLALGFKNRSSGYAEGDLDPEGND